MLINKIKNTLSTIASEDKQSQGAKKKIEIQLLTGEQIKSFKLILDRFRDNVETIQEIGKTNSDGLREYVKEREKEKMEKAATEGGEADEQEDEKFTFQQDLSEMKDILNEVNQQMKDLLNMEQGIVERVSQLEKSESTQSISTKNIQQIVSKYEAEIANLKKSEQNNKQILTTLGQQSQLYLKQMKDLQQKSSKLEKDLNDKNILIGNLKQQKNMLLQMRNQGVAGQIPEVQALKTKLSEFEKRLLLERTKVEQKQKQIEGLRKRMQQDRESLQKIADELKQKQLKSKKVIDKYERSKTEIRKFREEKTEFIKQLHLEMANVTDELTEQKKKNEILTKQIESLNAKIQQLNNEVNKNENRKIELESNKSELIQIRKQLHQKNVKEQQQQDQLKRLKQSNQQLQQKRKQLLQALQKPVNHEIRTLQKILRALDKLYKQYITTVFQQGNIVGFQTKITYIISNVQQIKQDLLM